MSELIITDVEGTIVGLAGAATCEEVQFTRARRTGVLVTAPNGQEVFLTDDVLDELFEFQRHCYIQEG